MKRTTCCALVALAGLSATIIAAEPSASPAPSAAPSPAESPTPTIAQSVTELSAQRAAAERSKIYRAGASYSQWLDQFAKDSGSAFLQRPAFGSGAWVRFISGGAP